MDRIPTTNEGALGGSRDVSANPAAGGVQGRFGDRRVSDVPQTPRPYNLEVYEAGSGVAPAKEYRGIRSRVATGVPSTSRLSGATASPYPGRGLGAPTQPSPPTLGTPGDPRASHGPAGSMVVAVTDAPGTSSGARAAGAVRGRGTLPTPVPRKECRSRWKKFVAWCNARDEQPWPARPELVADFLKERTDQFSYKTLCKIRSAVATTHRLANLNDPCSSWPVRATLAELARAKGRKRRVEGTNISGRLLVPTQFDAIRAAVFEPRLRGKGVERPQNARSRGLVDLALCSLVLEAGLRCNQAAALEWQDLKVDTGGKATVTVRSRWVRAGTHVEISERAHEDLRAIKPASAGADQKVFAITARHMAVRVRAAAEGAGLGDRIEGEKPRRITRAATTGASLGAACVPHSPWQAFCAWCDARGWEKLPARAETVAAYLREGSWSAGLSPVMANAYAIMLSPA